MEEKPPRGMLSVIPSLALLLCIAYSIAIEPHSLAVTRNAFNLSGTGGAGPIKAVLISDIHSAYEEPGYFNRVVQAVQSENPDIILIAGDTVEGREGDLAGVEALKQLKAPYGVFAVFGNHDYRVWRCGDEGFASRVGTALTGSNITVLRNENRILDIRGRSIALIGVDDLWACQSDYAKASKDVPDGIPRLILAHQQDSVPLGALPGRSLVLSGHTHCGQIRVPIITDLFMGMIGMGRYPGGRYQLSEDDALYVTCGITPGGVRFLAPPEISVIEID